jgi:integrase
MARQGCARLRAVAGRQPMRSPGSAQADRWRPRKRTLGSGECGHQGRPFAAVGLTKIHRQVCALADLCVNRMYDLRYSYATIQLYEHHAPIQYVSEQLGHASIKIPVDTYGHPRQEDKPWQIGLTLERRRR